MRVPVLPLAALAVGAALFLLLPFRGPRNSGTSPGVTPAMVSYAARRWPDATAAQLDHGRNLIQERCIECHHRPGPEMAQAAQWPRVLRQMAPRSKLSDGERETVLRYLLSAQATVR